MTSSPERRTSTTETAANQTRAAILTAELDVAYAGFRSALANVYERRRAVEAFFDDLGMDDGTLDNPPLVARDLVEKWIDFPADMEIEGLFGFYGAEETPSR